MSELSCGSLSHPTAPFGTKLGGLRSPQHHVESIRNRLYITTPFSDTISTFRIVFRPRQIPPPSFPFLSFYVLFFKSSPAFDKTATLLFSQTYSSHTARIQVLSRLGLVASPTRSSPHSASSLFSSFSRSKPLPCFISSFVISANSIFKLSGLPSSFFFSFSQLPQIHFDPSIPVYRSALPSLFLSLLILVSKTPYFVPSFPLYRPSRSIPSSVSYPVIPTRPSDPYQSNTMSLSNTDNIFERTLGDQDHCFEKSLPHSLASFFSILNLIPLF